MCIHKQKEARVYCLSSRIVLGFSDWLKCEILTTPAMQERPTKEGQAILCLIDCKQTIIPAGAPAGQTGNQYWVLKIALLSTNGTWH